MRRAAVTTGVVICAVTILALGARSIAAGGSTIDRPDEAPQDPNGRARVALPEEDPNFVSLVDALAERAALYRKYALGFTCRESVTTAKYDTDSTNFRKSDKVTYDYLFEEQPGG